jgi:glycosyltransferase involved in cell wall biosynthesis
MMEMYLHNSFLHSYDKVDAFIAPSLFIQKKMIEGGIAPERIHLIKNFVRVQDYTPNYENDGYLLYFGQVSYIKGIDVLLKALQHIPKVRLIVAGRGDGIRRYKRFCQVHNLKVSFIGFQSGRTLRKLISNCLAVVVPSVCYESFGLVVLEAFACGKPVVGSNHGGIAELIVEDETGYLFDPGNSHALAEKINMVLNYPEKLKEMGHAARKKVESEFNSYLHIKKIIELYNRFN